MLQGSVVFESTFFKSILTGKEIFDNMLTTFVDQFLPVLP
jgi:hypothetical protein